MSGPSNPDAKEIPSEKYFPVIEKKIEQSKILKLQKSENFDFFEFWEISKILIFGGNLGAFWCFFMIHGATRANGDSGQVTLENDAPRIPGHLAWLNR